MKRSEILDTAEEYISKDRNTQYSEPENNFQNIANLWNSYLIAKCGVCIPKLTAEDVGIMMTLLKVARMASGSKEDNFIDAAGYIACAGEIATENNKQQARVEKILEKLQKNGPDAKFTEEPTAEEKAESITINAYAKPLILDGVVCMYEMPTREEMDLFWHDVLTSNGDID